MAKNKKLTKHITIKTSNILIVVGVLASFGLSMLGFYSNSFLGFCILAILLPYIAFLHSKSITIVDTNANYQSWFTRTSIKKIESINASGVWIFNSVKITGRGASVIKMNHIANLAEVKQMAEQIGTSR